MMTQHSGTNTCLEQSNRSQPEICPKDREESVKELVRPSNLRQEKDDNFKDDEQAVEDCPEYTSWLIRDCTTSARKEIIEFNIYL